MIHQAYQKTIVGGVVLTALLLPVVAQAAMGEGSATAPAASSAYRRAGFTGFQHVLEHNLGLTPEQSQAIHGLLAQQHDQLRELRQTIEPKYSAVQKDTDAKIRALLNPEQQEKFDALLAKQKASRPSRTHQSD